MDPAAPEASARLGPSAPAAARLHSPALAVGRRRFGGAAAMAWEEVEAAAWEAAAARAFIRLLHSGVGWGRVRRGRGLTRAGFRAKRGLNVVGAGDTARAAALPRGFTRPGGHEAAASVWGGACGGGSGAWEAAVARAVSRLLQESPRASSAAVACSGRHSAAWCGVRAAASRILGGVGRAAAAARSPAAVGEGGMRKGACGGGGSFPPQPWGAPLP